MNAKTVVVTGNSTGIGASTAEFLIAKGFHVFGGVRSEADGARLQSELGQAFTPLIMDVTDGEAISAGARDVTRALGGASLAGIVNNAEFRVQCPPPCRTNRHHCVFLSLVEGDWPRFRRAIDLNDRNTPIMPSLDQRMWHDR